MMSFFKAEALTTTGVVTTAETSEVQMINQRRLNAIKSSITSAALNRGLRFIDPRKIALISGAGIAGLAASFELLARGFNVVIAEKRKDFNRFNLINLDVETQRFLKKFSLLNEFETSVAARIEGHHLCAFSKENGLEHLQYSDVSKLQPGELPFEPEFFNQLFKEDGVYSVRIKDLQIFLAKKALEAGVHILGNVEVEVLTDASAGDVAEVQITAHDPMVMKPHLFFVAEGVHSKTAAQRKMKKKVVKNDCTGENWIFGNVAYFGEKTFVVSMIDTSGKKLEIANIIFNAQIKEINIAVTSEKALSEESIKKRLLNTLNRVSSYLESNNTPQSVIAAVEHPVRIKNQQCVEYSKDNVFYIGDAAGNSSPLAGMGGTVGLTLVPGAIERLLNDCERYPAQMHYNFGVFSEGYTSRWIEKSQAIKQHCIGFFNEKKQTLSKQEQTSSKGSEQALKSGVPK